MFFDLEAIVDSDEEADEEDERELGKSSTSQFT